MRCKTQTCTHTPLRKNKKDFPEKKWLALKDLKNSLQENKEELQEEGEVGERGNPQVRKPGGPSVTGWLRGVPGAHIN